MSYIYIYIYIYLYIYAIYLISFCMCYLLLLVQVLLVILGINNLSNFLFFASYLALNTIAVKLSNNMITLSLPLENISRLFIVFFDLLIYAVLLLFLPPCNIFIFINFFQIIVLIFLLLLC